MKLKHKYNVIFGGESPPTRAEWIEIYIMIKSKEVKEKSPPTRAEWIEINKSYSL